jgi:hypothetical protein
MSCDIVDENVIDYLVFNLVKYKVPVTENPSALGKLLTEENVKSVSARYREPARGFPYRGYNKGHAAYQHDPLQVLKTINYYRYQTCEHAEWTDSRAFQLLNLLEKTVISKMLDKSDLIWGAPLPLNSARTTVSGEL